MNIAPLIVLLLASVITIPLFRRLGLGSVLGYLAAGLAIGPFGFRVFTDPQTVISIAELGVVMFLSVIGLEMEPLRLWELRRQILGLGPSQVVVCTLLTTGAGMLLGVPVAEAVVAEVRRRDQMRLAEQIAEGVNAGNQFFRPPGPVPEPFSEPAVPAEEIADREAAERG